MSLRNVRRALSFVLLCLILSAAKDQDPLQGLPTLEDFDWQIEDDPWTVYRWTAKAFESMGQDTPLVRRVRITNYFMRAVAETGIWDLAAGHIQSIEEYWQKTSELALTRDRTSIGLALGYYYRWKNQIEKSDMVFKQTIAESRHFHDYNTLIRALIDYALRLDNGDQKAQGLQYYHEVQELAANESLQIQPFNRHRVKLMAALRSYNLGTPGLNHIIEASMQFIMDKRTRYAIAIFAYNVAVIYLDRDEDFDRTVYYMDVSLREARSLDDKSTIGAVLMLQAKLAFKQGKYLAMEKKASEAVQLYSESNDLWLARAFLLHAESLWKLNRLNEALVASKKARSLLFSDERLHWRSEGYKLHAAIQEDLGLYKEALGSYKEFQDIEAKIASSKETENFARARVDLGLQMEEQKNLLLQKENELQAARLRSSRYLLLAAIALTVLLLGAVASTIWAISNSRKIQKAREKIQIILDVIEEGILTINHKLLPEPEYSQYLTKLYPDLFQGSEDAIDWLFPKEMLGSEGQSIIRETLRACLGEDSLSWELNLGQLPSEIVLPGAVPRSVHILWQPLLNGEQRIRGFLLSLRDISEQKLLQDEVRVQQEKSRALERRLQEILLTRFQDATRLLETLHEQLSRPNANWLEPASRRDLHTRKGEARTLGLKGLSQAIHELETSLSLLDQAGVAAAIEGLREEAGSYRSLIRDVFLGRSAGEGQASSLIDIVAPLLPSLRQQLKDGGISVQTIEVSDGVTDWPLPILDSVRQALLHALSNSADHGYILPQGRGKILPPARLRVEAETRSGLIEVRVRDFGVGLDLPRLQAMAREKGFVPGVHETAADVVFLDGATTAEEASATSGRGVGLSAVREICRSFQGEAHLRSNDQGRGSLLCMTFTFHELARST
ncbi:MAG: ATP-binding protein [Pseudobdellovibrionaceae bacterium]|nr:ATP-binding protein [Pseudobdellovibrionaceae bacterium]